MRRYMQEVYLYPRLRALEQPLLGVYLMEALLYVYLGVLAGPPFGGYYLAKLHPTS